MSLGIIAYAVIVVVLLSTAYYTIQLYGFRSVEYVI